MFARADEDEMRQRQRFLADLWDGGCRRNVWVRFRGWKAADLAVTVHLIFRLDWENFVLFVFAVGHFGVG